MIDMQKHDTEEPRVLVSATSILTYQYQYSISHTWYTSRILWTKWYPYLLLVFVTCTYFTALIVKFAVTIFTLNASMYWNTSCYWKCVKWFVYDNCLLLIIMTTCPSCGKKVLSDADVQCRSCYEYYHMNCISWKGICKMIHSNKYNWLCSNCLADIFPFNQIEDENELIDGCQLNTKNSLKISDLIYNPFKSNSSDDHVPF